MIRLAWFVGLCAVLVTTSAYSQNRAGNVYVGAALGMTWYPELEEGVGDFENELRREGFTDFKLSTSSDERAFAWNLFAGYAVSEVFAIEAGYLGSGKVSMGLDLSGTLDGEQLRFGTDAQASRWSLYGALVGHVPMNSFVKPFGKIGIRWWDDEIDGTATIVLGNTRYPISLSEHDNGFGLLFGIGADVPMTESASFRIEYLHLPLGDDHGGDEHRAHVGMYYTF